MEPLYSVELRNGQSLAMAFKRGIYLVSPAGPGDGS